MNTKLNKLMLREGQRITIVALLLSFVLAVIPVATIAFAADSGSDAFVASSTDAVSNDFVASSTDAGEKAVEQKASDKVSDSDEPVVFSDEPLMLLAAEPLAANIAEGECGTCSWVIDDAGVLTIKPTDGVSGTLANNNNGGMNSWPWFNYAKDVTSVVIEDGVSTNSSAAYLFYEMGNCTSMDLSGLDTSNATKLDGMFSTCSSLTTVDVSGFKTSSVTSMKNMFYGCRKLTTVDVSGFDTSKVTNMSGMFNFCSALTNLDVTEFDTSNVTNMSKMFYDCSALTSLNVTDFNTSNVTNMSYMFYGCEKLTTFDVGDIDTSKVTDMSWLFGNCSNLNSLNVSGLDTSNVTNMSYMFQGCNKLTALDVSGFDTSKVTNMGSMFGSCYALSAVDVSNFKTSNVTNMGRMFNNCRELTGIDVSGFDTSKVTDMSDMFAADTKLSTISVSAKFTPATNYEAENSVNFFNVVDGTLIVKPKDGYAIKSITVGSEEVEPEFDEENGTYTYAGFTGDSVAVIEYAPAKTVTFMDGETEVEKQVVAQGNDATDPYADPSKIIGILGKHFTGWDKVFENVQENITVYALYELNDYVLTFDANGGEGTMAPVAFKYGTAQNLPENAFTREGHTFTEWNTKSDGSGDSYADKASVLNLTDEHDVTVTLYAQWELALEPQIILTTDKAVGETLTFSMIDRYPQDYLYIDFGDGNPVRFGNGKDSTDGASLSNVTGTIAGSGSIKLYSAADITKFICKNQGITSIDFSNAPALAVLNIEGNKLTSLDLSNNGALYELVCQDNQLTSVKLDGCLELQQYQCDNNKLTELDVSDFAKLEILTFSGNQLTEIDLTNNPLLHSVNAADNQLTEMAFHDDVNLLLFACSNNKLLFSTIGVTEFGGGYMTHPQAEVTIPAEAKSIIDVIDLSSEYEIAGVKTVYTWYDAADDSVVTPKTAEGGKFTFDSSLEGKTLYCTMQNATYSDLTLQTTEVEITKGVDLQITFTTNLPVGSELELYTWFETSTYLLIDWGDGTLTPYGSPYSQRNSYYPKGTVKGDTIKIYGPDVVPLNTFQCENCGVTELDLSGCPELETLYCNDNALTELDLSNNPELTVLDCSNNALTQLDLTNSPKLEDLFCGDNSLNVLNVLANPELTTLYCDNNALTDLDISSNTKLEDLYCSNNSLNALDVSANPALIVLDCGNNNIPELDVSDCTELTVLACNNNTLTSETLQIPDDLSKMETIVISCNDIASIDLSTATNLMALFVNDTKLSTLDVSNMTNLIMLCCDNTGISSLDLSNNQGSGGMMMALSIENTNISDLNLPSDFASIIFNGDNAALMFSDLPDPAIMDSMAGMLPDEYLDALINEMDGEFGVSINATKLFEYAPQALVEIPEEVDFDDVIDLSSEYEVYGENTVYKWFDGTAEVTPTTSEGGKFTFGSEFNGKNLRCEMTNALFPDLTLVTTEVRVFSRTPFTGTPSVKMDKEFFVDETIPFEAVGYWADTETTTFGLGDERYVPMNWHHADPSGNWGGKDDPTFAYTDSFKQSKAGNYTLKVEFQKYVHDGTDWNKTETVTLTHDYTVKDKTPSGGSSNGGSSESPKTGDDGIGALIALYALQIALLAALACVIFMNKAKRTTDSKAE